MERRRRLRSPDDAGIALVVVVYILMALAIIGTTLVAVTTATLGSTTNLAASSRAQGLARGGVNHLFARLETNPHLLDKGVPQTAPFTGWATL
ncbi:MAG: hypothetical protein ACRD0J_09050, partial [Acidimicrobiales bacterium]